MVSIAKEAAEDVVEAAVDKSKDVLDLIYNAIAFLVVATMFYALRHLHRNMQAFASRVNFSKSGAKERIDWFTDRYGPRLKGGMLSLIHI